MGDADEAEGLGWKWFTDKQRPTSKTPVTGLQCIGVQWRGDEAEGSAWKCITDVRSWLKNPSDWSQCARVQSLDPGWCWWSWRVGMEMHHRQARRRFGLKKQLLDQGALRNALSSSPYLYLYLYFYIYLYLSTYQTDLSNTSVPAFPVLTLISLVLRSLMRCKGLIRSCEIVIGICYPILIRISYPILIWILLSYL